MILACIVQVHCLVVATQPTFAMSDLMKTHLRIATPLLVLCFISVVPAHSIACELHDSGFLQNSFDQFHLPPTGAKADDVSRVYGKPNRVLNGPGGQDIWDYGSFRVIVRNSVVTFAAMW